MTNFKESIEAGLKVARDARTNKEEVSKILETLNNDLLEATSQILGIGVYKFDKKDPLSATIRALSPIIADAESYKAIAIVHNESSKKIEVARWRQNINGYPCTISFGDSELTCHDAESLTSVLAELMASPNVGRIILSYLEPRN